MTQPEQAGDGSGSGTGTGSDSDSAEPPLRVSTLELFFDLVFVFTITQLTGILSHDVTVTDGLQVLLIFGALWWMYDGYVWLSNARTPTLATERLLMLTGMAGFLIVGLAIPHAFGRDGVALGIGYLILVVVHSVLYQRVNRNIARVTPFNLAAALLVIGAGVIKGGAAYAAWAAALALLALSPLIVQVRGRFAIQPVALRRAARGPGHHRVRRVGGGHRDRRRRPRRERVPGPVGGARAGADRRAVVGLLRCRRRRARRGGHAGRGPGRPPGAGLFRATSTRTSPMLLGVVALASGVKQAIVNTGRTLSAGPCVALGCGVALFLAGTAAIRYVLRTGAVRYRLGAAAVCLAASVVGVTVSVAAEMALLTAIVAVSLAAERRGTPMAGTQAAAEGSGEAD